MQQYFSETLLSFSWEVFCMFKSIRQVDQLGSLYRKEYFTPLRYWSSTQTEIIINLCIIRVLRGLLLKDNQTFTHVSNSKRRFHSQTAWSSTWGWLIR
jgi:hypothetical protein